jgi:hypothetical protein
MEEPLVFRLMFGVIKTSDPRQQQKMFNEH